MWCNLYILETLLTLNQIKSMIETFSIKEEKFINEIYHIKLNVSFNKKIIFNLLEKKDIFPSLPLKKNIIFIPIIVNFISEYFFFSFKNKVN